MVINIKKPRIISILIAVYCALIPLENVLAASLGGSVNKYIGIAIIISILIWKSYSSSRLNFSIRGLLPILSFAFFALLSVAWTTGETGNSYYNIMLNMTVFTIVFVQYPIREDELVYTYVLMVIVGIVLSLLLITGSQFASINNISGGRMTLTFGGLQIDNNNLAVSLFIPIVCSVNFIINSNRLIVKLINSASLILMMYAVLVTGSRGGLLAGVVGLTVYAIKNSNTVRVRTIILWAALGGILLILIQYFLSEGLSGRFSIADVIQSGGTGRTIIWSHCLDAYKNSNPFRQLFGYGYSMEAQILHQTWGPYTSAHNDFLQVLLDLGLIGEFLYVSFWINSIKQALKTERYVVLALVIVMLVSSLSMEVLVKKMFWLVVYLNIVPIQKEKGGKL